MIKTEGITKSFGSLQVLKGIDLTIGEGEIVAIVGPSGAGKTTLLQIIGTLDAPDSGKLYINGTETVRLSEEKRAGWRSAAKTPSRWATRRCRVSATTASASFSSSISFSRSSRLWRT